MSTYDEISKYSKIPITKEEYTNLKNNIMENKLSKCIWNKAGSRVHYNNYRFLERYFNDNIKLENDK